MSGWQVYSEVDNVWNINQKCIDVPQQKLDFGKNSWLQTHLVDGQT